jgi:hypothetical protein
MSVFEDLLRAGDLDGSARMDRDAGRTTIQPLREFLREMLLVGQWQHRAEIPDELVMERTAELKACAPGLTACRQLISIRGEPILEQLRPHLFGDGVVIENGKQDSTHYGLRRGFSRGRSDLVPEPARSAP